MHPNVIFDIVAFLFAISIHESAHAWSAHRLGDSTARLLGRISLNPLRHIDLVGTVLFPLFGALSGLPILGWAKPTPVNTGRLGHPRRDDVLVSAAGPASNFLVALVAVGLLLGIRLASAEGAAIIGVLSHFGSLPTGLSQRSLLIPVALLFYRFLLVNVLLGVFNLIPIPPLDGSHILAGALPERLRDLYSEVGRFGFLLLFLLLWTNIPYLLFSPVLGLFHSLLRL